MNATSPSENRPAGGAPAAPGSLPVLYGNPEALTPASHGNLRLLAKPGFDFARNAHAIPIAAPEMPAAMRSYPIVFAGPHKMPVIIVGMRRDENLFIEEDGSWIAPHYVPAYVRRYPFVLAGDEGAERLTLCVDRDSDRVIDAGAAVDEAGTTSPFFDGNEPGEATKNALAFCEQFQGMVNATRAIVAKVAEHGLFAERQSNITLSGGETLRLTDFQVIDEAALNALPDDAFLDLRKANALALIYCHLASMNSWSSLLHQANAR